MFFVCFILSIAVSFLMSLSVHYSWLMMRASDGTSMGTP